MGTALQCEICGGKLVGKPGGVFECDSCGMEYSTEWAKAKIQEIKGTVQVEGTVEVTGKVQVEGGSVTVEGTATKASLLKRAKMCCAEGEWKKAEGLLEQVLNADPECGEAYLYKYMAQRQISTSEEFYSLYVNDITCDIDEDRDIQKAFQYASGTEAELLNRWKQEKKATISSYMQADVKHQQEMQLAWSTKRNSTERASGLLACGGLHTVGLRTNGTVMACGSNEDGQCNVGVWQDVVAISCGRFHTVGLHANGTVVAVGSNKDGQCNVGGWNSIIAIASSSFHTVGLCANGTVMTTGKSAFGQCNTNTWRDIIAIACSNQRTVGLRSDGTVAAAGMNNHGQCDVSSWRDIIAITCSDYHTVGLCSDGTVTAAGMNNYGQCNVSDWRDIIAIACSDYHTVGLRSDGTVVAVGKNDYGQCDVNGWRYIVTVVCSDRCTVGLCADGTVVTGYYKINAAAKWTDIIAVRVSGLYATGLRTDGTVIAVGDNEHNQCNTTGWKLFTNVDILEEWYHTAKAHRIAVQKAAEDHKRIRRAELACEHINLEKEQRSLKGLFSGRRRKEIESRLVQIEQELKEL